MKLLFLPNWNVFFLSHDDPNIKQPNKVVRNSPYWFFKHWHREDLQIDVIDYSKMPVIHKIEKHLLRFYVIQTIRLIPYIHKYDLIISHGTQSAILLAFMRSLLGIKTPPHIIIDVGCLNGGRSRQLELLLFQFAMRSLSGLIYHVSSQKEHYKRYFPWLLNKAFFIPFGVDTDFFTPANVKSGNFILSIGYKYRDWKTLIEGFETNLDNIELKIVGPSKRNIGPVKSKRDITHYPYLPILVLKNLIAKAKFIVLPLLDIPYAHGQMTLLQSMAMGKAVIVSKVPASTDYICDGETGLFVRPGDPTDIRNKIKSLLHSPKEINRLGRNARISVLRNFTEKTMAEAMYRAINKLNIV